MREFAHERSYKSHCTQSDGCVYRTNSTTDTCTIETLLAGAQRKDLEEQSQQQRKQPPPPQLPPQQHEQQGEEHTNAGSMDLECGDDATTSEECGMGLDIETSPISNRRSSSRISARTNQAATSQPQSSTGQAARQYPLTMGATHHHDDISQLGDSQMGDNMQPRTGYAPTINRSFMAAVMEWENFDESDEDSDCNRDDLPHRHLGTSSFLCLDDLKEQSNTNNNNTVQLQGSKVGSELAQGSTGGTPPLPLAQQGHSAVGALYDNTSQPIHLGTKPFLLPVNDSRFQKPFTEEERLLLRLVDVLNFARAPLYLLDDIMTIMHEEMGRGFRFEKKKNL